MLPLLYAASQVPRSEPQSAGMILLWEFAWTLQSLRQGRFQRPSRFLAESARDVQPVLERAPDLAHGE
jgi:hypothetical protein